MKILFRLLVLAAVVAPWQAGAAAIDLTRYLQTFDATASEGTATSFTANPGAGRLIVTSDAAEVAASIELNGALVAGPTLVAGEELPVDLVNDNTINVRLADGSDPLTIRIKQIAEIALNVEAHVHFNTNVSSFEKARAFYASLGFETLSGFPDTNTLEMAQAIGIETPTEYDGSKGEAAGGYLLHGELIGVGGNAGGLIDLIEFTIPRNDEPPYASINHLGMASAAMLTADLDADFAHLSEQGVRFLGPPAVRADGRRFAVFKDLDGTFYELTEAPGEADEESPTNIFALGHVTINVSDFERSAAWYQMLGYELTSRLPESESSEVAAALGLQSPIRLRGAVFTHPVAESQLVIQQWLEPFDGERAYPLPVNHLGINRIALTSSDIEADVAALKAQGVEFVSPITPCCSGPDSWGSIVAFHDPDGTIVELVDQPFMDLMMRIMRWFS